jgi:hypothetical protein
MGGLCSICCPNKGSVDGFANPEARAGLIRSENLTAEALLQTRIPPAPLLKDINFAAIADDAQIADGSGSDLDEDEVQKLLEEESQNEE